jgi:hypothetical protein
MNGPFPKTVYRTPNPEIEASEAYEIMIERVPGVSDTQKCWIVRELHGYWDEGVKTFHHKVETLHPADRAHLLTLQEAIDQANEQVRHRAREGFRFLFTLNWNGAEPWYDRFEVVLPAGQLRPLP